MKGIAYEAETTITGRVKHTLKFGGGRRLKDIIAVPDEGADPLLNQWAVETCEDFEAVLWRDVRRVCASARLPRQKWEDVKDLTLDLIERAFMQTTDLGFKEERGNKFAALFRRSLRNWCVSARRWEMAEKRRSRECIGLPIDPIDHRDGVVEELIQRETLEKLEFWMKGIGCETTRYIVHLRIEECLSYQDIAALLKISASTVHAKMKLANMRLLDLLGLRGPTC